jgi:hypothetical protein
MDYNLFLWQSKLLADAHQSNIPKNSEVITSIRGMSTPETRHCMNNINRYGENYLEIGSHRGSTFVSSMFGHNKKGWSIDNYTEFCDVGFGPGEDGTHKQEFMTNIRKHLNCQINFFEEDSFKFDLSKITEPVDVYMYDGDHDQDKQRMAIEYYYPVLNDIFLFIVDDWNSQAVRDGTYEGIKNTDCCILAELPLRTPVNSYDQWWSGIYMAFLAKECPSDMFLQTSLSAGGCNYAHPIKSSRPRDVVLRLRQPENDSSIEKIEKTLQQNFPDLSSDEIQNEIKEGLLLLEQQKSRGRF